MDIEKMIQRIQMVSLSCNLKTDEGIRHFHNGHEYVEIGGIKWATMNVGAEKPTDYGLYFQWGDVQGYTADQVGSGEGKKYFYWKDYKYGNGGIFPGFKDMAKYNDTDGKTVLDSIDDAVNFHWGGSWRMPIEEEFKTLMDVATYRWVADYQGSGINGYLFIDKIDKTKKLFIPPAGSASSGCVSSVGSSGRYWSSSLSTVSFVCGGDLCFRSWNCSSWDCGIYGNSRFFGFSVRGVAG